MFEVVLAIIAILLVLNSRKRYCRLISWKKRRKYSENDLIKKTIETMFTAWIQSTSHDNDAEFHG